MTNLELVLNMLAEATTTEISWEKQPEGLEQNRMIANVQSFLTEMGPNFTFVGSQYRLTVEAMSAR